MLYATALLVALANLAHAAHLANYDFRGEAARAEALRYAVFLDDLCHGLGAHSEEGLDLCPLCDHASTLQAAVDPDCSTIVRGDLHRTLSTRATAPTKTRRSDPIRAPPALT